MAATSRSLTGGEKLVGARTLFSWAIVFAVANLAFAYHASSGTFLARDLLDDHSVSQAVILVDIDARPSDR